MKTERIALSQIPRLSLEPRIEQYTPRGQAGKNRLESVVDKCLTLQNDLSDSWKKAKYNAFSSLSTYEIAKRDLSSPQVKHWNSDPAYQTMQTKISKLTNQDSVKILSEAVQPKKNRGAYDGTQATISVQRTKVIKRKAREVQELLFLPLQMLGKFHMVKELEHHKRRFGEEKEIEASNSETWRRRESTIDEMEKFWKGEIQRYDQSHTERILGKPEVQKTVRKPSIGSLAHSKELGYERHLSPLQLYILNYNTAKLAPEGSITRRRQKLANKMQGIQPSPDVLALSRKYLPKFPVSRKSPVTNRHISKQFHTLHQLRVPKKTEYETAGLSEDDIMQDIRKEMSDVSRMLQVETILVKKDRDRFLNRGK